MLLNRALLEQLCACHATPGDEGGVFDLLASVWEKQGLAVSRLGAYAMMARRAPSGKPVLLLTAHADSPGFTVSELAEGEPLKIITLGGPHVEGDQPAVLKTRTGLWPVTIRDPGEGWKRSEALQCELRLEDAPRAEVRPGDRVCWPPRFAVRDDGVIESPFLDNRLGCALLAQWFEEDSPLNERFDVVLGVTALEEVNGFGAAVLARQLQPDVVVALDATYASAPQRVILGGGPVLTLSDASVVLSPALRDRLLAAARIQLEVYNFSGTDAKAFPQQGLPAPVLPVLLPTGGNHSPLETVHVDDFAQWKPVIEALVQALA